MKNLTLLYVFLTSAGALLADTAVSERTTIDTCKKLSPLEMRDGDEIAYSTTWLEGSGRVASLTLESSKVPEREIFSCNLDGAYGVYVWDYAKIPSDIFPTGDIYTLRHVLKDNESVLQTLSAKVLVLSGSVTTGSASSASGLLDTLSISAEEPFHLLTTDSIAYSTLWQLGDRAVVSAVDTNDPEVSETIWETEVNPEEGFCRWNYELNPSLPRESVYKLTHTTYRDGLPLDDPYEASVTIIPEPALFLALLLGLGLLGRLRRNLILLAVVTAGFTSAITVSSVKFAQRWPWNGLVDIDYTIGSVNPNPLVKVFFKGRIGNGEPFSLTSLSGEASNGYVYSDGAHRTTWDASKDAKGVLTEDFSVIVQALDDPMAYVRVDIDDRTASAITFHDSPPDLTDSDNKTRYIWFRKVPACTFLMGSKEDEPGRVAEREALHAVTLTKDYYIGVTELTLAQYNRIQGKSNSSLNPVYNTVYDTLRGSGSPWPTSYEVTSSSIVGKLRTGTEAAVAALGGKWIFDLPTEAQWECACKAGTQGTWNDGSSFMFESGLETTDINLSGLAFYSANSSGRNAVAQKAPNKWGLYDMHGNVGEWCLDWFGYDLSDLDCVDPRGPLTSEQAGRRVVRGGYYGNLPAACRSAARVCLDSNSGEPLTGVRLAMVQE